MDNTYKDAKLVDNLENNQFELWTDQLIASIIYRLHGDQIHLLHTEVEPEFQGKGAGTSIIERTLQLIEQRHLALTPYCPFVVAYIKRHPEWKRILAPGVHL